MIFFCYHFQYYINYFFEFSEIWYIHARIDMEDVRYIVSSGPF